MSFSPLSTRLSRLGRFLFGGMLALLVVDFGLRLIEVTPLWRILPVVQPILGQPDKDFGFESTPDGRGGAGRPAGDLCCHSRTPAACRWLQSRTDQLGHSRAESHSSALAIGKTWLSTEP